MNVALTAEALAARLTTRWLGRHCEFHTELASTNSAAARRAEEAAPDGLLVVAETQTQGRGRLQRSWHSPAGLNLYFSLLLRPVWELPSAPPLALAAGVGIAEAIEPLLSGTPAAKPELKWPNDVLSGGKKLAGILLEGAAQRQHWKHVILGIGLNVNQTEFPDPLAHRATSLQLARGRGELDRLEVLALLLASLEHWIDALAEGRGPEVIARWCQFAPWLGQKICVSRGDESVYGTAVAVDSGGALRLRDDHGEEQLMHCGDASGVMGWAY